jgi:hypothetical protein
VVKFNAKYGVIGSGGNDLVVKIWHLKWRCLLIMWSLW